MPTTNLAPTGWPKLATSTAAAVPLPDDPLLIVLPSGEHQRIEDGLTIGQANDNRLVLDDPCVSRRHCVIERAGSRMRVRDLSSKNGTYLNGVRIDDAQLEAGAVIAVGGARLRIVAQPRQRSPLVGSSAEMRDVRRRVSMLGPTRLPVLIVGETGTGKELVARALHDEGRFTGAFIALNCGAIAAHLVESDLFGHEKGAFTGATERHAGVFRAADGGTLFLDEVGELPLALQPRLLRALEVGAVRPVGATREIQVKVRVVAATHVDLEAAVARGAFREDLYYRLCGDVVRTPPLRERPSDIAELAMRLLGDEGLRPELDADVLAALSSYPWPGNVRELRNVLRRASVLGGARVRVEDLQLRPAQPQPASGATLRINDRSFFELEREILASTIQRHGGNKRAAAHALGIPKSTLCDKAKRYGIG